jgi:hypothetical protein
VEDAAPELLGLSLEEVGHAAALHWGLPAVAAERHAHAGANRRRREVSPSDWIAGLSTMAARAPNRCGMTMPPAPKK